jgi:hypothetical protein
MAPIQMLLGQWSSLAQCRNTTNMFRPKPLLLFFALLLLGGCKLYMAGHSSDYSMIVTGTGELDMGTDTMVFSLVHEGLDITCSGKSQGRTDGVQGHEGGYTCTDGRSGGGKSQLTHMEGGTGAMTDTCGNSFQYVWGTNETAIKEAGEQYRQIKPVRNAAVADKCNKQPAPTVKIQQAQKTPESSPPNLVAGRAASPDEQRLASLKNLHDRGLIDDEEFKAEKKAVLARMFTLGNEAGASASVMAEISPVAPVSAGAIPNVEFGRYFALVIGNNTYQHLPDLRTAVNDAKAVAGLLEQTYGFSVTLLLDATRADIIEALDGLTESLSSTDNLLIYYAGHGVLDEGAGRGYWLAVDAKPNRRTNWVSNSTLTDTLSALQAKHVMVVADSCFSGTLVRAAKVGVRAGDYWRRMAKKWTRVALVSGGLEPVSDGSGNHSPFAKALLSALRGNPSIMDGTQLFDNVRRPVMTAANQTPQYADVRQAGHDGGDFLFVRKK